MLNFTKILVVRAKGASIVRAMGVSMPVHAPFVCLRPKTQA